MTLPPQQLHQLPRAQVQSRLVPPPQHYVGGVGGVAVERGVLPVGLLLLGQNMGQGRGQQRVLCGTVTPTDVPCGLLSGNMSSNPGECSPDSSVRTALSVYGSCIPIPAAASLPTHVPAAQRAVQGRSGNGRCVPMSWRNPAEGQRCCWRKLRDAAVGNAPCRRPLGLAHALGPHSKGPPPVIHRNAPARDDSPDGTDLSDYEH